MGSSIIFGKIDNRIPALVNLELSFLLYTVLVIMTDSPGQASSDSMAFPRVCDVTLVRRTSATLLPSGSVTETDRCRPTSGADISSLYGTFIDLTFPLFELYLRCR